MQYKTSPTCLADSANSCNWLYDVCAAEAHIDNFCNETTTEAECIIPCAWDSSSCSLKENSMDDNVY